MTGIHNTHIGNKVGIAPDLSTRLGAILRKLKRRSEQPAPLKSKPDGHRALGLVTALILLATLVLPLIPTGTVMADSPATFQPSDKDNYLYEYNATLNLGGDSYLSVCDRTGRRERPVLGFDISSMDAGVTITSATLHLYYYNTSGSESGKTLWAYQITKADWTESGSSWQRYKSATNWATAGGDYVTSDPSGGSVAVPASYGWIEFDVTDIVEDVYGGSNSVDVIVRFETEGLDTGYSHLRFYSNNYGTDTSLRPKLVVEYAPPVEAPTVVTNAATDVSYTTATLNGEVTATGGADVTTRGFEWGTDSGGPYPNDWHEDGTYGTGTFSRGLTGLDDDTTYYYRAYATNSEGTSYGAEGTFTTLAHVAPTVVTHNATGISYTIATLNGEITAIGGINAGTRGFQWGTATGVYAWSWNQTGSYGTGAFDHDLTGLDAGQTYYFRAFAVNEGGTGYGAELSFTALAYVAPAVVTLNATAIDETRATISGNITSIGSHNATARGFDWGYSTGNYTGNWTEAGDFGSGDFSYNLTALPYNTTIYYRGKAQNLGGWAYGAELTFTTLLPYPGAPTNFTITQLGYNTFELTWDTGTLADTTVIRVSELDYPASTTGGIPVYSGSGNSVILTGLDPNMTSYYYTAWSENSRGFSDDAAQAGLSYPLTVIQAMFIVALCIIGFWKRGWIRIIAAISIIIWGAYMTAYDMKIAAPLISMGALLFFMGIFTLIRGYRESQA